MPALANKPQSCDVISWSGLTPTPIQNVKLLMKFRFPARVLYFGKPLQRFRSITSQGLRSIVGQVVLSTQALLGLKTGCHSKTDLGRRGRNPPEARASSERKSPLRGRHPCYNLLTLLLQCPPLKSVLLVLMKGRVIVWLWWRREGGGGGCCALLFFLLCG